MNEWVSHGEPELLIDTWAKYTWRCCCSDSVGDRVVLRRKRTYISQIKDQLQWLCLVGNFHIAAAKESTSSWTDSPTFYRNRTESIQSCNHSIIVKSVGRHDSEWSAAVVIFRNEWRYNVIPENVVIVETWIIDCPAESGSVRASLYSIKISHHDVVGDRVNGRNRSSKDCRVIDVNFEKCRRCIQFQISIEITWDNERHCPVAKVWSCAQDPCRRVELSSLCNRVPLIPESCTRDTCLSTRLFKLKVNSESFSYVCLTWISGNIESVCVGARLESSQIVRTSEPLSEFTIVELFARQIA